MSNVLDAREAFASRSQSAVKLPAFAPNLRFLRDLCAGVCRTCTTRTPVEDADAVPVGVAAEIGHAIDRNVHGVREAHVHVHASGWHVTFETEDTDGSEFVFSFLIREKWIVRENQDQPRS